jgi:hypothetical protein
MNLVKLLKEVISQSQQQSKYENWEKGVIKAWGQLLYLSYHNIPNTILKIVDEKTTKKVFEEYYEQADSDEDLQDWMSDEPPTMNKGFAVFDKNRISQMMSSIANKTKLEEPLTVYRYDDTSYENGWNSYTTNINDAVYAGKTRTMASYILPVGYPVIFADDIADKDEVIVNMSAQDKSKFLSK